MPPRLRPPREDALEAQLPGRRRGRARNVTSKPPVSVVEAARRDVNGPLPTSRDVPAGPVLESVNELGRALALLVDSLPQKAVGQLLRLVGHSLAAPPSGLLREARLGLLIRLLRERQGELVDTTLYEAERERRRLLGEVWPASTTIARAFGDWLRAQMAAVHLAFLGTHARRPRSLHHAGQRAPYTKAEVIAVLVELRRVFGMWLISGEYLEFVELRRRAALQLGQPEPRLPTMTPLNRLFGGYAATVAQARAAYGEIAPAGVGGVKPSFEAAASTHPLQPGRLHPAAATWWNVVRGSSEADRRFLYQALARHLRGCRSLRDDVWLSALARCRDEIKTYPSFRRYEEWRGAQTDPDEWPTARSIRSTYRSWSAAVVRLGAESSPDILVGRLCGRSQPFSAEEILVGIDNAAKDWKQSHPGAPFRFLDYRHWADAELCREPRRYRRLARSIATIIQHVGPWAVALTRAGHADLLTATSVTTQRRLSDEELLDYVYWAAQETELGAALSPRVYDEWSQATSRALQANDPTAAVPRYEAIRLRFGSWAKALYRAELLTDAEYRRRLHGRGVQMSDRQLADAFADALCDLGPSASRTQYRRWREDQLTGPAPPPEGIPTDSWLCERLGNGRWRTAKLVAAAQAAGRRKVR